MKKYVRLSREQRDNIAMITRDPSVKLTDLARVYGVDVSTISRYAVPRSTIRRRERILDHSQEKQIIEMSRHMCNHDIANILNISESSVARCLTRNGVFRLDQLLLTDEQKQIIETMYRNGATNRQISLASKINTNRVAEHTATLGHSNFFRARNHRNRIIALYKSGKTQLEISKLLGIAQTAVSNYVRHLGINNRSNKPRKKPVKITNEMKLAFVRMKQNGKTQKQIAEAFGVAQATVSKILAIS